MKAGATGINSHILEEVTTLADCCKIVCKDSTVLGFTSHDRDIIYDGVTYKKNTAYSRNNISNESLSVSNLDIDGLIDSVDITASDIRSGKFSNANIYFFMIDWKTPANGIIKLLRGTIGKIELKSGIYTAEINGLTKKLQDDTSRVCPRA